MEEIYKDFHNNFLLYYLDLVKVKFMTLVLSGATLLYEDSHFFLEFYQ